MHPALIKAALELASPPMRQADVARQCGVTATVVHDVIHGNRRSKKVELRIAASTRLPLAELWPEWHGPGANRRRKKPINTQAVAEALRALAG